MVASKSTPGAVVRPRFSRTRIIMFGIGAGQRGSLLGGSWQVTLATGSTIWLKKNVPFNSRRRLNPYMLMPVSVPVRCSAVRPAFASVITFPCRNERYNSFRVGARKARYTEAVQEILGLIWYSKVMRGLKASLDRSGKFTLGDVHAEFT